jgi:hypothetical protein
VNAVVLAERWLDIVRVGLPDPDDPTLIGLARRTAAVRAGHLLRERATGGDAVDATVAQLYGRGLAQEVAGWAVEVFGHGYARARLDAERIEELETAYVRAPALPAPDDAALRAVLDRYAGAEP